MGLVLCFPWLTPPQANDRHLELAGQTEIFRKHPRKASILNMPLVTTLFYSCFYHYSEAEVKATRDRLRALTAQRSRVRSQYFDVLCYRWVCIVLRNPPGGSPGPQQG